MVDWVSHFTHGAHTRLSSSTILFMFMFMHLYMLSVFVPMPLMYTRAVVGKSAEYLFPKLPTINIYCYIAFGKE